ncbi:PilZ domain-containing protein [Sphingomonas sp.]|uniref:PilZ domain-containing protein n=1 Tax=Sphingomonas sp. TaxID=28214 RepID=UPI0025F3DB8B|nr:PilZ domain-containing protein [Sphingomonas sp.]
MNAQADTGRVNAENGQANEGGDGASSNANSSEVGSVERQARDSLFLSATLRVEGQATPITVRVRNLSNGGMMVDSNAILSPGQTVRTDLRGIGPVTGTVAWVEAGRAGVAFDDMVDPKMARYQGNPDAVAAVTPAPQIDERRPGLKPRG